MPKSIIALCGPKGVGKSTLAKEIVYKYNYAYLSFATPLKGMLYSLLLHQGLDEDTIHEMINGSLKETPTLYLGNRTPRYCMQTLGTEWRDLINKELWTNIWKNEVEHFHNDSNIVVEDLRFLHEASAIRSFSNTTIVRIEREGFKPSDHTSEREFLFIPPDFIIGNDNSIQETLRKLKFNMKLKGKSL